MSKVKISMLLVLVALVVFCLGFLMVPAVQACAPPVDCPDQAIIRIAGDIACIHEDMHRVVFWGRVQAIGVWGIVIAVLGLAFVMRRRAKTDK